ncbi:hypothetical protein E4U43_002416 [Claviceps pusilla]|uniref:Uncharacterized protein n=1 Tax=Claviceps pusilla TaxID=123648 RepID=A0A9P7N8V9_9HYPO|nr:hypothetical protein E4U43_002416 [Claviceps pusilla]
MAVRSTVQSATMILVPPDRSKNPVEKLAYELLCQEYRSRYTRLSSMEKADFRRVLGKIVVKPSMMSVARHTFGDIRVKRIPTLAEFELLAILYGVRGCARGRWFPVYAAKHPEALEPRFKGIIAQIDKSVLPLVLEKRQPLPPISMDKVELENSPRLQGGQLSISPSRNPRSSTMSNSLSTLTSSPRSSVSSAFSGSVMALPAASPAVVGAEVDDNQNRTTEDGSRRYVEEILAPTSNISGSNSTSKPPANLAQVVAELESRVAHNTTAVLDMQHALSQFKERIISLGNGLHTMEIKNQQMVSEVNSLGISHYNLREEQTELQRRHAQLCEAIRAPAV